MRVHGATTSNTSTLASTASKPLLAQGCYTERLLMQSIQVRNACQKSESAPSHSLRAVGMFMHVVGLLSAGWHHCKVYMTKHPCVEAIRINTVTFQLYKTPASATGVIAGINNLTFGGRVSRERPPLWSSGQTSCLLTQRSCVRVPTLPDFLSSSESGTGSTQPL
jgi:hypothetical protein